MFYQEQWKILPREINRLQFNIMVFIKEWANTKKIPIPRREIISCMTRKRVKYFTTINALNSLLKKEYIRHAYTEKANTTSYVMIRNI